MPVNRALAVLCVAAAVSVGLSIGAFGPGSDAQSQTVATAHKALTYQQAGCTNELGAEAQARWPGGSYDLDDPGDIEALEEIGKEAAQEDEAVRLGYGTDEEVALELESDRVAAEASKRWPDTFAGAWGEQPANDRFHIAFTEAADEKVAQLAEDHPCPDLLQAETAENSIEDLETRFDEVIADRGLAQQGTLELPGVPDGDFDAEIDEAGNAIVVILENATPEAIATFHERYGSDLIVQQGELMEPE